MACGTPVVASNVTSVPEVVGDAAVLVNPYNPKDVAEGMHKCFADRKLYKDLIRKGLARAREFSWQKTALQTISAYEKIHQEGW
jgi:glycosyltransferase involved in cell wall biosynthesis